MSFWDEVLSNVPEDTETPFQVLVVSHGGAIRHLIEDLVVRRHTQFAVNLQTTDPETLKEGIKRRIGNCCITEVQLEELGEGWTGRLVRYADEDHFLESSRAPSRSANEDVME